MHFDDYGWLVRDPGDPEVHHFKANPARTQKLEDGVAYGHVTHYAATTGGELGMAERLTQAPKLDKRTGKIRSVGWHFTTPRDGSIAQTIAIDVGGRHVKNAGMIGGRIRRTNKNTTADEKGNAGHLHRFEGEYFASYKRDANGIEKRSLGVDPKSHIKIERVFVRPGSHPQERYTEAQIATTILLWNALLAAHPHWTIADLLHQHMHFDAPSKMDPGDAWTLVALPEVMKGIVDPTPEVDAADPLAALPLSLLPAPKGKVVALSPAMTLRQRMDYTFMGYRSCVTAGEACTGEMREAWALAARGYFDAFKASGAEATLKALAAADRMAAEARRLMRATNVRVAS